VIVHAEGASTLLFLPLAHVFARFIQVLCVSARAEMGHTADVKNLLDDLAAFRPTFVLAVPRVFEKVYNSAEAKAEAAGKGKIFHAAADTAIAWSEALDDGGPGLTLRTKHALFDKLVYGKLREALGGRVTAAVSGGAPLGARLGHFFRGIGVTILEGWGLTETTAPATVNCPDQIKIGTVGRPLPGVTVQVADDGELLVKGINVMLGYFNNAEATAAALENGWFHTGDIGEIDEDGFVRITGRKKEIIVTAGGKNVAPAVLEDRLRAHPLVSQCIVVGDHRPFIACLVTLDAEMLPTWLSNNGRPPMDVAAAATDPQVRAEVQRTIDHANLTVSKAESIRRFLILDGDFTEASGHLTPKLNLKRQVVLKDFATQVEQLYR
jgi:long-chain acyl-CoA synthetase